MQGPEGPPSSKPEQLSTAEELQEIETEALLQSIGWTLRLASRHAQRTTPDDELATFESQLTDYANPCVWLLDCSVRLLPDESHDHKHRKDTATFAESFLRAFDERAYSPVCGQCDNVFTVRQRHCARCGAQRLVVPYEYRSLDDTFVRRWQRYWEHNVRSFCADFNLATTDAHLKRVIYYFWRVSQGAANYFHDLSDEWVQQYLASVLQLHDIVARVLAEDGQIVCRTDGEQ